MGTAILDAGSSHTAVGRVAQTALAWAGAVMVMEVAVLDARTLDPGSMDYETRRASPTRPSCHISLCFFPYQFFLLPSPITYISQCPKHYKVYMNITYKNTASFVGTGKEGVVK